MVNREGGFKPLILKVGIEFRHLFRQHHTFVDDRTAGKRAQIKLPHACGRSSFFNAAADDVKLALELFVIDALFVPDQDLLNLWPRCIGLFTKASGINRHMTPAVNIVPHPQNFGFDNRAAPLLRAKIRTRQEHLTDCNQFVRSRLMACAANLIIEKLHRDLHMDACAITCLSIGVHSAAMPNGLKRVNPVFHHAA